MNLFNFLSILEGLESIPVEARPFVVAVLVFLVFAACMVL